MTLRWEEEEQQEKLQLYDIQPDGSGRLDWAAAEEVFDAKIMKLKGRGPPGVFPSGELEGLTRDIFQPGSVLQVTVTRKQGKTQATGQSNAKQALSAICIQCNRSAAEATAAELAVGSHSFEHGHVMAESLLGPLAGSRPAMPLSCSSLASEQGRAAGYQQYLPQPPYWLVCRGLCTGEGRGPAT